MGFVILHVLFFAELALGIRQIARSCKQLAGIHTAPPCYTLIAKYPIIPLKV